MHILLSAESVAIIGIGVLLTKFAPDKIVVDLDHELKEFEYWYERTVNAFPAFG